MPDIRPGSAFSQFVSKGLRSVVSPAIRSRTAVALIASATTAFLVHGGPTAAPKTPTPTVQTTAPSVSATSAPRLSYESAMADQAGFRRMVRETTDRYPTAKLAETMLGYARIVNHFRSPSDRTTDAMYGIDDAQWAWMMRNHAESAGLADVMSGVHVNRDGTIDAVSAQALQNMLDLKHDVAAATRVFASWLADQTMQFDGQSDRTPTPADIAMIAIAGDEEAARQAAHLAKEEPSAKLGAELRIPQDSWRYGLFADGKGWKSAAEAVSYIGIGMAGASAMADQPIEPRTRSAADATTASLRAEPAKLAGIVARTVADLSEGSVYGIHAVHAAEFSGEHLVGIMSHKLMTLATSIDRLRGEDLSGGIYAISPGQWIAAIEQSGASDIQADWTSGVELRKDGSVHAKDAKAFGDLMRLRDDPEVATRIVATRLAMQMDVLKKDFARIPHDGLLLTSHLHGIAAAEAIATDSMANRTTRVPQFAPEDPRSSWGPADPTTRRAMTELGLTAFAGAVSQGASAPARALESRLLDLSVDSQMKAEALLSQHYRSAYRRADAGPSFDPGAELARFVDRGVDAVNGAVGTAIGKLTEAAGHAAHRPAPDEDAVEAPRPRM